MKNVFGVKKLKRTFQNREKIILRDFLAMERTTLANERTLFSYLKAGVYFVLAGFAFLKVELFEDMRWVSYSLFALSAIMIVYGLIRFGILKKKLDVYYEAMEREHLSDAKKDK